MTVAGVHDGSPRSSPLDRFMGHVIARFTDIEYKYEHCSSTTIVIVEI